MTFLIFLSDGYFPLNDRHPGDSNLLSCVLLLLDLISEFLKFQGKCDLDTFVDC